MAALCPETYQVGQILYIVRVKVLFVERQKFCLDFCQHRGRGQNKKGGPGQGITCGMNACSHEIECTIENLGQIL